MRADQEISKNPAYARIAALSASFRITSKSSAGRSPHSFVQVPINRNARIFKESIHEVFGAARSGNEFGENRGGNGKISAMKSCFKRRARGRCQFRVLIP